MWTPTLACSPRTWGWTVPQRFGIHYPLMLPTHVGMDRGETVVVTLGSDAPHARGDGPVFLPNPGNCFTYAPHARGDGPDFRRSHVPCTPCSPRTWGWTADAPLPPSTSAMLPTHVGMDRGVGGAAAAASYAPHARGDGPRARRLPTGVGACSPRTWGWTARAQVRAEARAMLPTHVGMDRQRG